MAEFTIKCEVDKETPGAVKYQELGSDGRMLPNGNAKVGTIYVRKSNFSGVIPHFIEVTIKF